MKQLRDLLQGFGILPEDLAGTLFSGEVPVSDAFINRMIARRLAQHPHVASVSVAAESGDQLLVRIEARSRMVPRLSIVVRIEQQPDLPRDATLRLRWSVPTVGPIALMAGPLLAYFKAMPPGVRIEGDTALVDLRTLLRARGLEDVFAVVRRVAVHTRPGAVVVQIEAGV